MIFVALGTQKFQFNRLLKKIDDLIENKKISNDVLAQIGNSTYVPKHYSYCRFLNNSDYEDYIKSSSLIITHAGVGTILEAKRNHKPVIVVPRLSKFDEHIDDHQIEIATNFLKKGLVEACFDLNKLGNYINNSSNSHLIEYISNNKKFIVELEKYIDLFK